MERSPKHQKHTSLAKPQWGGSVPLVKGLVLAGGMSMRMGADKGMVHYHGIPHRDFLIQLLQKF
ncbi:MAG: NTP transferase domain-containing protein, partial [Saprospiraceae bacterium]